MIASLEETARKGASEGNQTVPSDGFAQMLQQAQSTGNYQLIADFLSSKGDYWSNLVAANPAASLQYHQSGWQKFMSKLGFRTGYDSFLEQQQLQSNEYLAGLMQQYYQEQYNSPANKAQQMRDAGLNPDLLGTEGVENSPGAPADENPMTSEAFAAEDAQQVTSALSGFSSMLGSCINGAIGIASSLQGIKSQRLDNAAKELALMFNGMMSSAYPDATQDFENAFGSDETGDIVKGSGVGTSNYAKLMQGLGLSKREQKRALAFEDVLRKGLKWTADSASTRAEMGPALLESFVNGNSRLKSYRGLNSDDVQDDLKILASFSDEVTGMIYDFQNRVLKVQLKQADKQSDYWSNYDGSLAAGAENESAQTAIGYNQALQSDYLGNDGVFKTQLKVQRDALELKKALSARQRELVSRLEAKADEGKWFSKALMSTMVGVNLVEDSGLGAAIDRIASLALTGATAAGKLIPKQNIFNNYRTNEYFYQ